MAPLSDKVTTPPLTVAFFIAWYAEFYAASELATTSIFIALFGATFASVAVRGSAGRSLRRAALLEEVLLPLANAASVALAFYSVLEDSGHHALLAIECRWKSNRFPSTSATPVVVDATLKALLGELS